MELSLERTCGIHPQLHRQRRMRRASWWFDQMRLVVDRALDRRSRAEDRPEQICFSLRPESN